MLQIIYLAAALLMVSAGGSAETDLTEDTCAVPEPWEAAIEDWATAERGNLTRHGRIMSLAPSQGYYVSDRIDLVPPPPPRQHMHPPQSQMHHRGPYPMPGHSNQGHHSGPPSAGAQSYGHSPSGAQSGNSYNHVPGNPSGQQSSGNSYQPSPGSQNHGQPSGGPSYGPPSQGPSNGPPSGGSGGSASHGPSPSGSQGPEGAPMPYDEWQATPPPPPGAGKIVNRPPNPYKDQFKPSYAPPSNQQPIPVHSADRVDTAPPPSPQKQVSETDLYLLRAIEKLVYRVDLMEKRMRKMEENVHYIVAGAEAKPEPCMSNFTRIGSRCYHFSSDAVNWKSASYACRKLKANLLELDLEEKKQFVIGVQANKNLKGADFWTGGLNPGLLWIWSHSATPVASNSSDANTAGSSGTTIVGEGRCLALVASHATADYLYRGQDCALRHRFVCEKDEDKDKLGNDIERVAKSLREKRKPKIAWD